MLCMHMCRPTMDNHARTRRSLILDPEQSADWCGSLGSGPGRKELAAVLCMHICRPTMANHARTCCSLILDPEHSADWCGSPGSGPGRKQLATVLCMHMCRPTMANHARTCRFLILDAEQSADWCGSPGSGPLVVGIIKHRLKGAPLKSCSALWRHGCIMEPTSRSGGATGTFRPGGYTIRYKTYTWIANNHCCGAELWG